MAARGSVLILEDDPIICELLECVFADDGHHVRVCSTPDQLLDVAGELPSALAVVDFWGNGHQELAGEERDQFTRLTRAVPTILITGRAWADRETGDELGLVAIVKKPFDVFDLTGLVSDLAARLSSEGTAARR
ncbi:MAG: hypothetical protein M3O34_20795 [Chloroflexota bacterium]|nr:hypothetical protein [Chloroflexota bacterium]